MTRKRKLNARCHACNVDALCPECGEPVSPATPFSDWLRVQPEIDSSLGYVTTNIDYLWRYEKDRQWMLLEEKRYMADIQPWQQSLFDTLDGCAKCNAKYKGFYVVRFQNTTPDDGLTFLNDMHVRRDELISFLKFER